MQLRSIAIAVFLSLSWSALALDDLVLITPQLEDCEQLVIPVLVHTMSVGDDAVGFAALVEREETIAFTQSAYYWTEVEPFAIFVDLLQAYTGGLIRVQIFDSFDNPTWDSIEKVPPFQRASHLERHVIPVQIPDYSVEQTFPRSDVYTIRVSSYLARGEPSRCEFDASTSIIVVPEYP